MTDLIGRAAELRKAAGVSLGQMGAHCGVAPSVIAAWESGLILRPGASKPEAARRWLAVLRLLHMTEPPG